MILTGDCLALLPAIRSAAVDAIVCDPPYALTANKKGGSGAASVNLDSPYGRARVTTGNGAGGFMGKAWDAAVPGPEVWAEALRVAKPGAHLVAFGGPRTSHRLVCAIEDAGWEIRDSLCWLFGTGFPKSRNLPGGFGTALKPAHEPICLARKPLIGTVAANVGAHGTGAINIDRCRLAGLKDVPASPCRTDSDKYGKGSSLTTGNTPGFDPNTERWPANVVLDEEAAALLDEHSGERGGHGEHRLTTESEGRADEVQYRITPGTVRNHGDGGGASRFFYTAKASRAEREAGLNGGERKAKNWSSGDQNPGSFQAEGTDRTSTNHHPTVKPLDLMRWLCRLVTPPGGLILDPFAGSGTTGCAAALEGFRFLGMEREPEYAEIARRRIAYWESLHQPSLDFGGVA